MSETLRPVVVPTTTTMEETDDAAIALTTLATTTTSIIENNQTSDHQANINHVVVANANTSSSVVTKCSRARRGKIKMKKMEKENNLLVTFSKRKSGLMKKASELCTMCDVQCALVVFSPAGKVFSFGHPSVDQVADRYLSGNRNPIFHQRNEEVVANRVVMHKQSDVVQALHSLDAVSSSSSSNEDLIVELRELEAALESAKKVGKELDEKRVARMTSCWWERPLQELNGGEIETLKSAMVDLKLQVFNMAKARLMPPLPAGSRSSASLFSQGRLGSFDYPDYQHGAAGLSTSLSIGGFTNWNNNNNRRESSEAGPSAHASGGN